MCRPLLRFVSTVAVAVLVFLPDCGRDPSGEADDRSLPVYRVVFGGDVTLGRRLNDSLYDEAGRRRIFERVRPLLRDADLAVVNGEGVIASGGLFADKVEPRPYMYRAHPNAVGVLADAGIDVVTAGNNHAGDYGPEAMREMIDRLAIAGIDVIGAGHDAADARHVSYHRFGDLVVAVVGADLTYTDMFAANASRPGSLYFNAYKTDEHEDEVVAGLEALLREARRYANVVLFTPHWGDCWIDQPAGNLRKLARRIIEAGYDGIVGHSAHWFQGVELIDGKPVVYDAGNLVLDFGGDQPAHRAFLWELEIDKRGVKRLKGHPLHLRKNEAAPAEGEFRDEMLAKLARLSKEMHTKVRTEGGLAVVDCRAGSVEGPPTPPATLPARPLPKVVRVAPSDTVIDALPEDATPVDVRYESGIRLVGYRLFVRELSVPKTGQFVALYWTADRPIKDSYRVHIEARGRKEDGKPDKNSAPHIPGDWLLPTNEWPTGKVIRDWTLFRLTLHPEGPVQFFAGLADGGRLLAPVSSSAPLEGEALVPLGTATFVKGAPWMFDAIHAYRKENGIADVIPRRARGKAAGGE